MKSQGEINDGVFRTANLPLAAFLSFNVDPLRREWDQSTCFWLFSEDPRLHQLVTEFSGGKAMVDARAYSYRLTQMRKEVLEEKRTKARGRG